MHQVVCDVAVRTICVASDAPVNRSCKTYPVTQTKQNNWTGEASLRPGKSKMRNSLEPSLEARESVDVLCCTTPGLVWDFNYVALLVELDYQMIVKARIFKIIW